MSEINWTRAETRFLINLYRDSPCLYDSQHVYADDKLKKNECLSNIQKRMLPIKPEVTVEDVKLKIRTLKTQLYKENQRRESLRLKGYGEVALTPILWCYKELSFLDKAQAYVAQQQRKLWEEEQEILRQQQQQNTTINLRSNLFPEEQPITDFLSDVESENNSMLGGESQNDPLPEVKSQNHSRFEEQSYATLKEPEAIFLGQHGHEKEESFCQYLCTELKRIKSEDMFDKLKARILETTRCAIAKERILLKDTAKGSPSLSDRFNGVE